MYDRLGINPHPQPVCVKLLARNNFATFLFFYAFAVEKKSITRRRNGTSVVAANFAPLPLSSGMNPKS